MGAGPRKLVLIGRKQWPQPIGLFKSKEDPHDECVLEIQKPPKAAIALSMMRSLSTMRTTMQPENRRCRGGLTVPVYEHRLFSLLVIRWTGIQPQRALQMVSAKGLHVAPRHEGRMFETVMSHETSPRKLGVPPRAGDNRLETKQHWNGTSTNITQVVWHMTGFPGTWKCTLRQIGLRESTLVNPSAYLCLIKAMVSCEFCLNPIHAITNPPYRVTSPMFRYDVEQRSQHAAAASRGQARRRGAGMLDDLSCTYKNQRFFGIIIGHRRWNLSSGKWSTWLLHTQVL